MEPANKKPRKSLGHAIGTICEQAELHVATKFEFEHVLVDELCELHVFRLIRQFVDTLGCQSNERNDCADLLEHLADVCWEKLHSGIWSQVHMVWRELNAWIAIGKVALLSTLN